MTTMRSRRVRRRRASALLVLGVVALGACGSDDDGATDAGPEAGPEATADLVGSVEGGDAYVAIVADEGAVTAYVCDGEEGEVATTSEWFTGDADGDEVELESADGALLRATLTAGGAEGSYTAADGSVRTFSTEPAEGDAGLYRAETDEVLAGFVVANDGTDRGGFGFQGSQVARPTFDPTTAVVTYAGVGEIQFRRL